MPTLHFDGASNAVRGTGQGTTLDAAVTIASIVRRTADTAHYESWFGGATSANVMSLMLAYDQQTLGVAERITVWDGSINRYSATTTPTTNTDWWLYVFTRAAGASPVRWHRKNLTTGAAWLHESESSGPLGNSNWPSMSGGYLNIGNYSTAPGNPGALNEGFAGDIALHGWWSKEMTDAQVEALANGATSCWWKAPGGVPASLTELTGTALTDLAGRETWVTTGATATGADPPWSFDQKNLVKAPTRYFQIVGSAEKVLHTAGEDGVEIAYTLTPNVPVAVPHAHAEIIEEAFRGQVTEVVL